MRAPFSMNERVLIAATFILGTVAALQHRWLDGVIAGSLILCSFLGQKQKRTAALLAGNAPWVLCWVVTMVMAAAPAAAWAARRLAP